MRKFSDGEYVLRVEILRQIDTWASNLGSECIFWLNVMAGTGKSTISRTAAQKLTDKGDLGASFFFKRGEGDRGHAGFFITTIAAQLVQKLPTLAPHVQKAIEAIEANPVISRKALRQQFEMLVLQPLGKMRTDPQRFSRVVIVIDALDESDQEEDVRIIIRLLLQVKHITSAHRFVPFIFGESHQFRSFPQTAAIACKGSGLNKSMKAQIAMLGEYLYHLKLWRYFLFSVTIHNLNRWSCFEAARARVEVLFKGYRLQNDRSHSWHSTV
jgi:hypothetical protein